VDLGADAWRIVELRKQTDTVQAPEVGHEKLVVNLLGSGGRAFYGLQHRQQREDGTGAILGSELLCSLEEVRLEHLLLVESGEGVLWPGLSEGPVQAPVHGQVLEEELCSSAVVVFVDVRHQGLLDVEFAVF